MAAVIYIAVVDTIFRFLSECDVKSGSMVGVDVARKAALLNNVRCLCDVVLGAEAEKALDSCNNESASPRDFTHNSIDRLAACESDMSFTCFSTRDGHDADGCVETTSLLRQSSTEGSTVDRTELNKSSTAQNCAVTGLSNDHGNGTDYDELAAGDSDLVIAKTQESGSAEPDSICLAECNSDAKHVAAVTDTNSADVVTDSNGPNLIDLTKVCTIPSQTNNYRYLFIENFKKVKLKLICKN